MFARLIPLALGIMTFGFVASVIIDAVGQVTP